MRACPALALLLPVVIATYIAWPRTRYFGNTAPGLVALLFIGLGMAHPDQAGAGFLLASIPFILIFVSGILADLMETSPSQLVKAALWALIAADILWSLRANPSFPGMTSTLMWRQPPRLSAKRSEARMRPCGAGTPARCL